MDGNCEPHLNSKPKHLFTFSFINDNVSRHHLFVGLRACSYKLQARVVRKVDKAIQRIAWFYPLDGDLSDG